MEAVKDEKGEQFLSCQKDNTTPLPSQQLMKSTLYMRVYVTVRVKMQCVVMCVLHVYACACMCALM